MATTTKFYWSTMIGVAIAFTVIGIYAFNAIYIRDSTLYNDMKAELVNSCMILPNRYFHLCDRYANWALDLIPAYILHNCYERLEKRNRKTHPSIALCASTYKISFANFASDKEVYCDSKRYC